MDKQRDKDRTAYALSLPKILLVDDEGDILQSLRRLLRKKFEMTTTVDPEEALRHLEQDTYAILLSDQRMPTMEGTELMAKAREISPDTVRIILTGYADINAATDAINQGGVYRFLQKPWNDAELLATLSQAADHFALVKENTRLQALTEKQNDKLKAFNRSMQAKIVERTKQISQLNEVLSNAFRGTTQMLAKLAEMHSLVMSNHGERVASLSKEIGTRMGLSDRELHQLEVAATLHDIGKIGMRPALLRKHYSVLSAEEKATLLAHATDGETLVKMVPHLQEAALLIRHHHERFEGKGFPDKLFGRKIPLGSRIIAAVNAYDNALNSRIIRYDVPEKAYLYVQECTPRDFDPKVVSMLGTVLHEQEHEPVDNDPDAKLKLEDRYPGDDPPQRLG